MMRLPCYVFPVFVLLLFHNPLTAADDRAYNRWAIVASPDVQKSGLTDLLTVELSKVDGIELVERERLDAATKELELIALFGAQGAGKRLKLGRMLKADALVLLAQENRGEKTFLRMVVSDCLYGARLHVEYFLMGSAGLEQFPAQCADRVRRVQQRFAGGVRRIIAVTPLVSRNLTHDYDHLQTAYASLLQSALLSIPGTAVLEIDEARHLARELQMAGDGVGAREVPLFVSGQYKMSTLLPEKATKVNFSLRVVQGDRELHRLQSGELPWSDTATYLAKTAPAEIARLLEPNVKGKAVQPVPANEQARLLFEQARVFSELGQWRRAADLREAGLLVVPDRADERLRLIVDYAQSIATWIDRDSTSSEGKSAAIRRRLVVWQTMTRHIEHVTCNRQVNPREAELLVRTVVGRADEVRGGNIRRMREEPPEVRRELCRFFRAALPRFPGLDPKLARGTIREPLAWLIYRPEHASSSLNSARKEAAEQWSAERQYDLWSHRIFGYVVSAFRRRFPTTGDAPSAAAGDKAPFGYRTMYDVYYDMLTKVELQPFSGPMLFGAAHAGESEPVEEFLRRLEATDNPSLVFAARRCRLYRAIRTLRYEVHTYASKHGRHVAVPASMIAKFDAIDRGAQELAELLKTNGYKTPPRKPWWDPSAALVKFRRDIAEEKQHALRAGSAKIARNKTKPKLLDMADDSGPIRVMFHPVSHLRYLRGVIKCRDDFDVLWTSEAIHGMSAKGHTKVLFKPPQEGDILFGPATGFSPDLLGACWDGEHLWTATRRGGLHVLSLDGKELARAGTTEGLPPNKMTPVMHAVEPGRCLIIGGVFDKGTRGRDVREARTWIASVSYRAETGSCRVRIFHQATKVPDERDTADQAFFPSWIARWSDPDAPSRRLMLIGRRNDPSVGSMTVYDRRPLVVDLDSGKVSVHRGRFPSVYGWPVEFASYRGRILVGDAIEGPLWVTPPKEGAKPRWTWKLPPPSKSKKWRDEPIRSRPVLHVNERYYVAGREAWWSVDPATSEVERFASPALPQREPDPRRLVSYGPSAHYGLVAWDSKWTLYRVDLNPQLSEEEELAQRYPHVPAADRDRHAKAAAAIRRLGGQVDRKPPRFRDIYQVTRGPESWHTRVQLLRGWKGGEDGLKHLAGLHNVGVVYLVEVPVTDEAMKHIAACTALEQLILYDARITDAGLGLLDKLQSLRVLRLLGSADGNTKVTGEGIERLKAVLPSLKYVYP